MSTLVLDCGEHCVGILSVADGKFRVYWRGSEMVEALARIQSAEEVVTYNGKNYDLGLLGEFAGLSHALPLRGKHSDMRTIRWSDEIWGSSLGNTYREYFSEWPEVPDTYEGSIEGDVLMTFELWKLWKAGQLSGAAQ